MENIKIKYKKRKQYKKRYFKKTKLNIIKEKVINLKSHFTKEERKKYMNVYAIIVKNLVIMLINVQSNLIKIKKHLKLMKT